jgi:hypothetical protein
MALSIPEAAIYRAHLAKQAEKKNQDRRAAVNKFIARKAGREELEQDRPPDFHNLTIAQLRMRLTIRGCPIAGIPTSEYADRLRILWVSWKAEFDAIKDDERKEDFRQARKALYLRTRQMFASSYKADPARKSFLDLPGEIRNMVYRYVLFENPAGEYASTENWTITLDRETHQLRPNQSSAYLNCSSVEELRYDRTVSTKGMLAALNKQLRHEIRTFFWSQVKVTTEAALTRIGLLGPKYSSHLAAFLQTIGRDGRAALTSFKMLGALLKYDYCNPRPFAVLKQYLQQCGNLRELEVCLPVENLFAQPPELGALQAYFLHGEPLNSPSLSGLVNFFQGFSELRSLKLHTAPERPSSNMSRRQRYSSDFLHFAFTGNREKRLVDEIRDQLRVLDNVEIEVISGREHIDDFEEWQKWQPGCRRP